MTKKYWDGENWLVVDKIDDIIQYYFNGEIHRKDGPADIWYYDNGDIKSEKYWYNGVCHKEDGPAEIWYYKNRSIKSEKYWYNGKKHRENGPAVVIYYMDGSIKDKEYWFNNIKFDLEKMPFEMPIDTEEKEFMFNLIYGDINDN